MIQNVSVIDKIRQEVELERQGMRRIYRSIGDEGRVLDNRWYPARAYRFPNPMANLEEIRRTAENQPRRPVFNSVLTRFSNLFSIRHLPIRSRNS